MLDFMAFTRAHRLVQSTMYSPVIVRLTVLFLLGIIDSCVAIWGVDVEFINQCSESLQVDVYSTTTQGSDSLLIEPGESQVWIVCDDLCSGWLGFGKEYSWTWGASVHDSSCSFSDSGSGSLTISGLDATGKTDSVNLYCSDMTCEASDAIDDNGGYDDGGYDDGGYDDGYDTSSSNGGSSDCASIADPSGSPSSSSGMAGVLGKLSNYIYEDSDGFRSKAYDVLGDSVSEVNFVDGPLDTQVGLVTTGQAVYVLFRGSESTVDYGQDLDAKLVPTQLGGQSVNVHSGFLESWNGVRSQILDFLNQHASGKRVYFAGHSLGAALAQMAALDLNPSTNDWIHTYAYAPPPIGDQGWVDAMSSSGVRDRTVCFINPDDPIPFPAEVLDSNLFASVISILGNLWTDINVSGVNNLRHACRTVMITSTSCQESEPVYNEDGSLEIVDKAMNAHSMDEYLRLVVGQCVDSSTGYPSCLRKVDDSPSGSYDGYDGYDDEYDGYGYEDSVDSGGDSNTSSGAGYDRGDYSGGRNTSESYGELEKFNLEMDWNPSSCYDDDACSANKIVNMFTFSEMTAKQVDRDQKNDRCWDKSSNEAKKLKVSDEVSKGTKAALECMFENSAGKNDDLWRDVYVSAGSCTGMSPSEYFDAVVRLYVSIGLNRIADDFGLLSHNGTDGEREITVDRDTFLDYVSERIGRKAWIECDSSSRILRNVLVCVSPTDPFLIQDCTMDRNDPTSTNGIPCAGELRLPLNAKSKISEACKPYLLSEPNPSLDGAQTRVVESSGSPSIFGFSTGLLTACLALL